MIVVYPNPQQLTFNQWTNELRKQDGWLPYPPLNDDNWNKYVAEVNMLNTYKVVASNGFTSWQDWANAFIIANQGDL